MQRGRLGLVLSATVSGLIGTAACHRSADSAFCADVAGCGWTGEEWKTLSSLAGLPEKPPVDRSNRYVGERGAEELGRKLFFEARLSGPSSLVDVLHRPVGYARAPKGAPTGLSCSSCHNLARAGVDTESLPGNVSIGAAWADTNALPVVNAAFYGIVYWNGRADSLWAQAIASVEGSNMNGSRLRAAWVLHEHHRDEYNRVFTSQPLPALGSRAELDALVETAGIRAGQCRLAPGCPTAKGCRAVSDPETGTTGCFPRFPFDGKPGKKSGCQPGDPEEPAGDAFDCMDDADQERVTQALVNAAKAIAAFEFRLISRNSAFDRYVASLQRGEPREYTDFPDAAERGARLFIGKAACVDCHRTPLLSDSRFHNVGVPQVGPGVPSEADCPAGGDCDCLTVFPDHAGDNCLPWGAADGLQKLKGNRWRRDLRWSDDPSDVSRKAWADMRMETVARGSWRTPSLRDVALTAPYMHNGSLPTLEAVVDHYNQGGSPLAPGARSAPIKPLFLTGSERSDLVAFLRTLTGTPLPPELANPPQLPP
jgi:cytochrome c peroxidase